MLVACVYFCLPFGPPGIPGKTGFAWDNGYIQYAPVLVGSTILLVGIWWLVSARHWFTGPLRTVDDAPAADTGPPDGRTDVAARGRASRKVRRVASSRAPLSLRHRRRLHRRAAGGNQLAVFTDGRDLSEVDMQAIAREMNLSETVFVLPATTDDADVRIRIFTPAVELPFAGHPTLGSAFVLGGPLQKIVIRLETGAGIVPVTLEREGPKIVFGRMDQPVPSGSPSRTRRRSSQRSASSARACRSSATTSARATSTSSSTRRPLSRHCPRTSARWPRPLRTAPTASPTSWATAGRRGCSRRTTASTRTRRPDRRPGRSQSTWPATGGSPFGDEIEISQGAEINRPSTLFATVEGDGDRIDRVEVGGSAVLVARGEFGF